jgi:hypothetical protein
LKGKISELESNRGITELKNGYQPRTNLVNDERGGLLADPYTIVKK